MNLAQLKLCFDNGVWHTRQIAALLVINEHGRIHLRQAGRVMGAPAPSVHRVLSALFKLHLIEREKDENDQRIVYVFLSEKGKSLMAELLK